MNENILEMRQVTLDRGSSNNVLKIKEFTLCRGELAAVIGPNGAGKSSLLQVINLLHTYNGEMRLFGQNAKCQNKTILRRRSAMVFQETLLLNDTVFNNVACALRFRGTLASEVKQLVYKALADFQCDHLAERQAHSLSGGEAQRVCIARALVTAPELLLLDEPFAAVDASTRVELIEEIRSIAEARGISVILVSHSFSDVLHFADRIVVMLDGSIVQDDKTENVMRRPINQQVAKLVGMDNIIPCRLEKDGQVCFVRLANGIRFLCTKDVIAPISVCCLPGDSLTLCDDGFLEQNESWVIVEGLVERVMPGVGTYRVLVKSGDQTLSARIPRGSIVGILHSNDKIKLAFNPVEAHLI